MTTNGVYFLSGSSTAYFNLPSGYPTAARGFLEVHYCRVSASAYYITQVLRYAVYNGKNVTFKRSGDGGTWEAWEEIASDIPSFYKNYATLDELSVGLGLNEPSSRKNVSLDVGAEIKFWGYAAFYVGNGNTGNGGLFFTRNMDVVFAGKDSDFPGIMAINTSTESGKICIYKESETVTVIKNNCSYACSMYIGLV